MKITDVKATVLSHELKEPIMDSRLYIPARKAVVVEVTTNNGITGMGESMFVGGPPSTTVSIIENELKKYFIGEDPFRVERLWERFYQGSMQHGRKGALIAAYSGMDVALWDIMGKTLGKPIYILLGGFRSRMRAYASGGFYQESKGLEELVREMVSYIKEGFTAVKMKVGRLSVHEDLERVRAVREAIGESVDLMVDANNAYAPYTAIKVGRELAKYNVYWFEEPVPPEDIEGGAKVAAALDIPVAAGEQEFTRYGFRDLIVNKAVDIIQPDVIWSGGLTECKKIVDMASAWFVPCAPHAFSSAFCLLSNMHLVGASANCMGPIGGRRNWYLGSNSEEQTDLGGLIELDRNFNPLRDEIIMEPIKIDDEGRVEIPDKPGLGIEINEKAMEKFLIN